MPLEEAYGREICITFSGNSSGGHSCSQHANCTLPQHLRHLWHCVVTKLHILEWYFIVPSTRCICVMTMLFNQLLDMPHLAAGWIILVKEKCSRLLACMINIYNNTGYPYNISLLLKCSTIKYWLFNE